MDMPKTMDPRSDRFQPPGQVRAAQPSPIAGNVQNLGLRRMRDQNIHIIWNFRPGIHQRGVICIKGVAPQFWHPRRAPEFDPIVGDGAVLQVGRVFKRLFGVPCPAFQCQVMIPANDQNAFEPLTSEPIVDVVQRIWVRLEHMLDIAAMDQDIAFQFAQFFVAAMGVADHADPHASPLDAGAAQSI